VTILWQVTDELWVGVNGLGAVLSGQMEIQDVNLGGPVFGQSCSSCWCAKWAYPIGMKQSVNAENSLSTCSDKKLSLLLGATLLCVF
jgi:hypothetical protein